ncbi:MAG TPA: hypothetical protein VGG67_10175 [Steroidobacteraceae bacterium]|jgi:hypothetical protein
MKTLLAVSAVTLTSAMYAVPASAGCTDPRSPHAFSAMPHLLAQAATMGDQDSGHSHRSIVGTWHVTYTTGGAPGGEAFIQWHSDGTEWENINFPILGGNICMGSWKETDHNHVFRNHFGWLYDTGALVGYFNETETDELSKDGNSYTGTNETKIYDLSGNMLADVTGTASAKRLSP